jgi:hypothetical protein
MFSTKHHSRNFVPARYLPPQGKLNRLYGVYSVVGKINVSNLRKINLSRINGYGSRSVGAHI